MSQVATTGAWYAHDEIGSNYRLTGFQAAILLGQLSRLDQQVALRQNNASLLDSLLKENPHWGLTPLKRAPETTSHAYHLYVTRYNPEALKGLPRQNFLQALTAENIPCSEGYPVILPDQPVFASHHAQAGDYSCSRQACQESVWLNQRVLLGTEREIYDIAQILERISKYSEDLKAA